jgi:hypothetical protein
MVFESIWPIFMKIKIAITLRNYLANFDDGRYFLHFYKETDLIPFKRILINQEFQADSKITL